MSDSLLAQLEVKIDDMIETLEILQLQVSDLEEKNDNLKAENASLKARQSQWENGLSGLLSKLNIVNPSSLEPKESTKSVEFNHKEAVT